MITHIALAKWKPQVAQKDIDDLFDAIRTLKTSIPGIIDLHCGENFNQWNMGFTHAVTVTFLNRAALDVYRKHSAHIPVGKQWDEMEETGIGIDFED